jgi:hypothetical protein
MQQPIRARVTGHLSGHFGPYKAQKGPNLGALGQQESGKKSGVPG